MEILLSRLPWVLLIQLVAFFDLESLDFSVEAFT